MEGKNNTLQAENMYKACLYKETTHIYFRRKLSVLVFFFFPTLIPAMKFHIQFFQFAQQERRKASISVIV